LLHYIRCCPDPVLQTTAGSWRHNRPIFDAYCLPNTPVCRIVSLMQGNHKLSRAACQISMFQTRDLNYTASNFIFITSVWIQIVIATAHARSRDTKPHALRTPRTSVCKVIITNFEFNYRLNNLTLFVEFSSIKVYENKSPLCSCYMRKDGLTERCILLDAQLGYNKNIQIRKMRDKNIAVVYKHIRQELCIFCPELNSHVSVLYKTEIQIRIIIME